MRQGLFSKIAAVSVCIFISLTSVSFAIAEEGDSTVYFFEDGANAVNAGLDTGYTGESSIGHDDVHFGWSLGSFYISGFSRRTTIEGRTVFLKNVGDTVTLGFRLDQDIDCLEGDDALSVAEDENGYDEQLGVPQTNFGRGTLVVRKVDYRNHVEDPQVYTNYLEGVAVGAPAEVDLLEEGDYEVALNYETIKENRGPFGVPLPGQYDNYRLEFNFSVRNGNCMVYPFDVADGSELGNSAFTENGFYLDLAKSRYLEINVERQIMNGSNTELISDTRFNRPAKDGEKYTDEGVYVIEVTNPSTGEKTTKTIYVGTDPVLKSYATTGRSVSEIEDMLSKGASISEDGLVVSNSGEVLADISRAEVSEGAVAPSLNTLDPPSAEATTVNNSPYTSAGYLVSIVAVVVGIGVVVLIEKVIASSNRGE